MPVYRIQAETVTIGDGHTVTRPLIPGGADLRVPWVGNTDGDEYLIVTRDPVGPLIAAEVQLADRASAADLVGRMGLTLADIDRWEV